MLSEKWKDSASFASLKMVFSLINHRGTFMYSDRGNM